MIRRCLPLALLLVARTAHAQRTPPSTYANPIDIDYRGGAEERGGAENGSADRCPHSDR